MNFLNRKRKHEEFKRGQSQESENSCSPQLNIEDIINPLKKQKIGKKMKSKTVYRKKTTIKLKDLVSVEKGYFNLPKEILEEAIVYKYKVYFLLKKDSGKRLYYFNAKICLQ